jgi:hypothetical protein
MTAQKPDRLLNEHTKVKLDELYLFGVIRGDIRANHGWGERYIFATEPTPPTDAATISFLWRKYIATFRLTPTGELELVKYDYPLANRGYRTQEVHEMATGHFWLVMKQTFFGPRTYIPFIEGKIVEDLSSWISEPDEGRPFGRHGPR